jgi:dolichyl-diphosphooligosaccharide--protein glycosyltransferase
MLGAYTPPHKQTSEVGYQITGFSNRTVLVDNNTWNNTHIATVGKMMSCTEEVSYPLLRRHDVDYVLVIFGGPLGYSGDDINKFLWMIRIGEGIYPDDISERNYFTPRGEYRVDGEAPEAMRNSLMYKMSYYRFTDLYGGRPSVDNVRGQTIPATPIKLSVLDEAFTSTNWIVRIYAVKQPDTFGRSLFAASRWLPFFLVFSPFADANTRSSSSTSMSQNSRHGKQVTAMGPSASASPGAAMSRSRGAGPRRRPRRPPAAPEPCYEWGPVLVWDVSRCECV